MTTLLRQRMHQDLQLAGLAEGTQKAYLRVVRQFAAHFHKPPDQISEQEKSRGSDLFSSYFGCS